MKHHYNKEELIELKRKYDMQVSKEAIEEIKHVIDLDEEIERLNNIINELLEFIEGMFDEEAISNSFNMTTKEFIEYIKSKLISR